MDWQQILSIFGVCASCLTSIIGILTHRKVPGDLNKKELKKNKKLHRLDVKRERMLNKYGKQQKQSTTDIIVR